jgi:hypothetical protein
MFVAKVENNTVLQIADYQDLFPDTSFTLSGPDADFLAANSAMPVSLSKPYDPETQQMVGCAPYIEDGVVYTVTIEPKVGV